MKLVAKPVGKAAELVPELVVHARVLTQFDDDRILEPHPPEDGPIRTERGGQDERVAPVILRAGHGVTVAEAIQLLGVERVHMKPALYERFDNGPSRNFNRDTHSLRSPVRQADEPFDEFPDRGSGVSHTAPSLRMPMFIDDHHLVGLGRPIDANPPHIRLVLGRQ